MSWFNLIVVIGVVAAALNLLFHARSVSGLDRFGLVFWAILFFAGAAFICSTELKRVRKRDKVRGMKRGRI